MGRQLGFPAASQEKAEYAYKQALSSMDQMRNVGIKLGFGADLLGATYTQQCRKSTIRREVFTPLELLRQATSQRRTDDAAGQARLHRAGRARRFAGG